MRAALLMRYSPPPPDIKLCNNTSLFVFFTSPVKIASSYIRRNTSGGAFDPTLSK